MSQFGSGNQPNNPYSPNPYRPTGGNPYQPGMSSGGGPLQPQPRRPQKAKLTWLWVLLGVGGVGIVSVCGCCIASAVFFQGEDAKLVQTAFENDPMVIEHIGENATVTYNFGESMAIEDVDIFIYDISGPKGIGKIRVKYVDGWAEEYEWAKLDVGGSTYLLQ